MPRLDLRAQGDIDLAQKLLSNIDVRRAKERFDKKADKLGARRQLLATALRLTPGMAPVVDGVMEACRDTLGLEPPLETYVYPDAAFNAAAVRPERGRVFVMVSSALLDDFEPGELRFVVGHELGHHLFEHHAIPVGAMVAGEERTDPGTMLKLFAWKRWAEISCDRAGLVCAGGLEPALHALFKVASGLRGSRVKIELEPVLQQLADLREEAQRMERADEPVRADWFSTHPFSPLRLRAAQIFAGSEMMQQGGTPLAEVEAQVQELMEMMDPSYLRARSESAEAMRRLLFAGGVLLAVADGKVSHETLSALEELLGAGSVPLQVNPDAVREDLERRVEAVRELVPPLRRAQVIRDLCIVAQADGVISQPETELLFGLADAVDVDRGVVRCVIPEHRLLE
jgi:hypothetical protein